MILIVRHGPKRGREPHYNRPRLKAVKRLDPTLYRRLRFHETGSPPPSLDGIGAVIFWLGDPLRELYPECFAEAVAIADEARARGLTLVNPPEALSNSIKSVQSRLWRAAGIPTPPYTRCEDRDALAAHLDTADLPLLVRRDEQHGQRPTRVCRSRAETIALAKEWPHYPCSVAPVIDVRQAYRKAGYDDIWATYFHAKRCLVFGSTVLPQLLFFADNPIVHYRTSTYKKWDERPYIRRLLGAPPRHVNECLQAEADYRAKEAEAPDLMRKAIDVLGLHYAAIDYCMFPDGKIVLWEANPYVMFGPMREMVLWRERNLRQIFDVVDRALIVFLRGLLD